MQNVYKKKTLVDLNVGDFALFTKTISASDVMLFAGISGDLNPLYMNEKFAEATVFSHALANPMLISSMICGAAFRLLKTDFYPLSLSFDIVKPLLVGDTITARAEVLAKDDKTNQVTLLLEAFNSNRELVVKGIALEQMEIRK